MKTYTLSTQALNQATWQRDNIEPPGNGKIRLGAAKTEAEQPLPNRHILHVGLVRRTAGAFNGIKGVPLNREVLEISGAYLETPNGDEYAPADLERRIAIEGCRKLWDGAFVEE